MECERFLMGRICAPWTVDSVGCGIGQSTLVLGVNTVAGDARPTQRCGHSGWPHASCPMPLELPTKICSLTLVPALYCALPLCLSSLSLLLSCYPSHTFRRVVASSLLGILLLYVAIGYCSVVLLSLNVVQTVTRLVPDKVRIKLFYHKRRSILLNSWAWSFVSNGEKVKNLRREIWNF